MLRSTDPATGELLGEVETSGRRDVEAAVDAARQAQASWAARAVEERAEVLTRFRRLLFEERDEMAELVTRESGKPLVEARMMDILTTLETAAYTARTAPKALADEKIRFRNPILVGRRSVVEKEPLGVVAVVAPWNYPLAIPATGVMTALVAGNSVVLKPSEWTPLVGERLTALMHRAGVPSDVLRCIHGAGETGKALVESDVDGVLFTGSVPTGKRVEASCAVRHAPVMLELGGKDPMVVLPKAKMSLAAQGAVWSAFANAGQSCASVERLYVPAQDHDPMVAAVSALAHAVDIHPGLDPRAEMGPLINDDAVARVKDQLRDAEAKGATVVCGGSVREDLGPRFFEPTVLTDVTHDMKVMREETFGPLLPVDAYGSIDDAVAKANDTEYGLTASVWGPSQQANEVARRLNAGTVTINDCMYTYAAPETPWGGWKASGRGWSHGPWGLHEVTRMRHIHEVPGGRRRSPWYFPYDEHIHAFLDQGTRFLHGGGKGKLAAGPVLSAWQKRS